MQGLGRVDYIYHCLKAGSLHKNAIIFVLTVLFVIRVTHDVTVGKSAKWKCHMFVVLFLPSLLSFVLCYNYKYF